MGDQATPLRLQIKNNDGVEVLFAMNSDKMREERVPRECDTSNSRRRAKPVERRTVCRRRLADCASQTSNTMRVVQTIN